MIVDNFYPTKKDMRVAYRKAKSDMFTSGNVLSGDIIKFERDLENNLKEIQQAIIRREESFFRNPKFLGYHTIVPKKERFREDESFRPFSSEEKFKTYKVAAKSDSQGSTVEPVVEFRLMSRCSPAMHVLSALWILKIGSVIDAGFSANSYANRIRRTRDGEPNERALGSFRDYRLPYKLWRKGAIDAIESGLSEKREVIVLSADARSYYHRLRPEFMISDQFYSYLQDVKKIKLSESAKKFHELFITSLSNWSKLTFERIQGVGNASLDSSVKSVGLPVGLSASAVIANVALDSFDTFITEEIVPLYYGRYVDDILLVVDNIKGFSKGEDLLEWIFKHQMRNLTIEPYKNGKSGQLEFVIKPSYLDENLISFSNEKNRINILNGTVGRAAVESIRMQMNENSSEWKSLPTLDDGSGSIAARIFGAVSQNGGPAKRISEMDSLETRRSGIALLLRDIESLERDLDISTWADSRKELYDAILDIVITPKELVNYWKYVSRVIAFAIACGDIDESLRIARRVKKCMVFIRKNLSEEGMETEAGSVSKEDAQILISGLGRVGIKNLDRWETEFRSSLIDCLIRVGSPGDEAARKYLSGVNDLFIKDPRDTLPGKHAIFESFPSISREEDNRILESIKDKSLEVFRADLGYRPARWAALPSEIRPVRGVLWRPEGQSNSSKPKLRSSLSGAAHAPGRKNDELGVLKRICGTMENKLDWIVNAIYYPTRPFNAIELSLLSYGVQGNYSAEEGSSSANLIASFNDAQRNIAIALSMLRGYGKPEQSVSLEVCGGGSGVRSEFGSLGADDYYLLNINSSSRIESRKKFPVHVGLGVFETTQDQFELAVRGCPDSGLERYLRFSNCLNAATTRDRERIDYLLFPEMSIPTRWFIPFAQKLQKSNINLIGGVEYLRTPHREFGDSAVANQVWAALSHHSHGFRSIYVHRQDKQRPAVHEREKLYSLGDFVHVPQMKWDKKGPFIVSHDGFIFGLLICSELTNIEYRSHFRGRVDALFVPEWNQDLGTFESLVEASALDLHCFVIQANNRHYGDSRVRVPGYKNYERDIIKHLGGATDYVVSCQVDVTGLRRFQSGGLGTEKMFKPVPDGFVLAANRIMFPNPEK